MRDITFTDEYAASIEQKQIAQEGIERTQHEAQQIRNLAEGERDKLQTEAEGRKAKLILEAEGEAQATLLKAEAQAKALKLLADALYQHPELLTYEYIQKLSPNIRAMLVPSDTPLILPLQDLVADLNMTNTLPMTATPSITMTSSITQTTPAVPTPVSRSIQ